MKRNSIPLKTIESSAQGTSCSLYDIRYNESSNVLTGVLDDIQEFSGISI